MLAGCERSVQRPEDRQLWRALGDGTAQWSAVSNAPVEDQQLRAGGNVCENFVTRLPSVLHGSHQQPPHYKATVVDPKLGAALASLSSKTGAPLLPGGTRHGWWEDRMD